MTFDTAVPDPSWVMARRVNRGVGHDARLVRVSAYYPRQLLENRARPASYAHLSALGAESDGGFPFSGNRHHSSFADRIFDRAPADAVRGKACQPNQKVKGIANWHKPEISPQNLVPDAPYSNCPGHTGT